MKKINKILVALVTLSVLLLSNTVGVFALQSFTDVGDKHWAKDYIENMEKKGIVTGYPDATFRPSENVSKLATIVMIFRTVKAAEKLENVDMNSLIYKHSMVLAQYNIPDWAKEAVAFAIEKEIIEADELRGFFKTDGSLENAKRSEVSIYLGKALNNYLKEDIKGNIITFDFNDAEFISTSAAPYVDLLVKKNIINGDENGNFNPNKPIIRAAVAKMFSIAYDVLSDIEIQTEPEKELTIKEGKILLLADNNNSIVVENSDGDKDMYKIEQDTEIIIDGRQSDFDDLKENENIKLYLDEDGILVKAEVDITIGNSEGQIHSIIDMDGYYLITIMDKDDNSRRKTYKTDNNTIIKLNDITANPLDLERGDSVTLIIEGDTIIKMIAQSKTRVYEGILESGIYFDENPMIKIKTSTQKIYELEVDEDAEVIRNDRNRSLMSLVKGDIVTITTEYDKVVKIVSTSIETNAEGVITEIVLGRVNKITILNDDGEEKTYILSPDVDIEIDDEDATINDLKLDYRVELEIESDVVTDIEAEKVEKSDSLTGIITEVHDEFDAITIKVEEGSDTKYYVVSVDDATITSLRGNTRRFSDLDKDDKVFVHGKESNKVFDFIADSVIIVEDN